VFLVMGFFFRIVAIILSIYVGDPDLIYCTGLKLQISHSLLKFFFGLIVECVPGFFFFFFILILVLPYLFKCQWELCTDTTRTIVSHRG
jgi:hypothetical protein